MSKRPLKNCARVICLGSAAGFMAAALTALPAGCAGGNSKQEFTLKLPPLAERLEESIRLTAEGEKAQDEGDDETAMELYQRATKLSADTPSAAWNNLGLIYMKQGNYMQATIHLQTAAQLAPMDPQPMYNLGLAFHKAGHDRKALESFILALDREPNYIEAIRGAAKTTKRLRLTEEDALERLNHALLVETDPTWRGVYERESLSMEARLEVQDR